MRSLCIIGLAVIVQASGVPVIAVEPADEAQPEPGWTTAIEPGGDTSLRRMEFRNAAKALGKASSPLLPSPDRLVTRSTHEIECRSHARLRTSESLELITRCRPAAFGPFGY